MSKITQKISNLREVINATSFDKEKCLRFLSSIEKDVNELEKEYRQIKEDAFDETFTGEDLTTIEAGVGRIKFNADNLALVYVMENLDAAIQKTNFRKVNEVLSSIS